ncbi:UNC93-like protein MFSD11 [Macrosteles quadrilineatus]|uniref:UNC93-like protein MFSD11 n=1 Tax=Macrosteles quadrilineatus TaxID=74068 RepID=UPI0023E2940C|nr:UNC93-like protein MFSD11 [Macrosteles quadrilineatus]XP_054284328.1 UNC93-like protein MFSD11 [Macrosteles quadrilineatus]XP_054284329.1 UNC93-like protein MFSD11 [Macrosteles quadrilineatus]
MIPTTFNPKLWNVIYLGFCFMVLFTADYTVTNMQKTLITSIHEERPEFLVDGYTSLGITYTVFALSLWLGPSMVSLTGPRYGMALAALGYTIYIFAFNLEAAWAIYAVTVIGGVSGGLLWTAEGNYLVLNSDSSNISRNVGIFWVFLQSSSLCGNIFTFIKFEGKSRIDGDTRRQVIWVLGGVAAASILAFLLMRDIKTKPNKGEVQERKGFLNELKKTWNLFITKEILILNITFCFTGMQHAFTYGVISPSVGFTTAFGNQSKQLVALSGICIAIGEVSGGVCQVLLNRVFVRCKLGRSAVIVFGFLVQLLSFSLIFINLPNSASYGESYEEAIIHPSAAVAMLCSFMLGLSDSCLNTQNFSILAVLFPLDSAQSCALYKFIKSFLVGIGFFVSSHIGLHTQLMILAPAGAVSTLAFMYVDRYATKAKWANEDWDSADEDHTGNMTKL